MRFAIALVLILVCSSCSSNKPPAVAATRAKVAGPVITHIVARDEIIVVRAGTDGPTYSLESKGGEVIVPAMTRGELAMSRPDLSNAIRRMHAGRIWAGKDGE